MNPRKYRLMSGSGSASYIDDDFKVTNHSKKCKVCKKYYDELLSKCPFCNFFKGD